MVVYHLHGQTGRFKVCANGMQNPGLGKFFLESHLPFNEQIISINRKTAAKLWSWYQRWLWRNENTNFWLEHSVQKSKTSGALHIEKKSGNFGWNSLGISVWEKVVPFHIANPGTAHVTSQDTKMSAELVVISEQVLADEEEKMITTSDDEEQKFI